MVWAGEIAPPEVRPPQGRALTAPAGAVPQQVAVSRSRAAAAWVADTEDSRDPAGLYQLSPVITVELPAGKNLEVTWYCVPGVTVSDPA